MRERVVERAMRSMRFEDNNNPDGYYSEALFLGYGDYYRLHNYDFCVTLDMFHNVDAINHALPFDRYPESGCNNKETYDEEM